MTRKRITWADAERLVPGIEAEWRSMLGQEGSCVPPSGHDWRVEVLEDREPPVLVVVQCDPSGTYSSPPEWRRWASGNWTHPYPIPRAMLDWQDLYLLPYSYRHVGPLPPEQYGPRPPNPKLDALLEAASRFDPTKHVKKVIYPMTPTRITHFIDLGDGPKPITSYSGSREEK